MSDRGKCYMPERAKVLWEVLVAPLDRERSPEAIRSKQMRRGYRGATVWECDAAGIVIGWEWRGAWFPGFSDRAIEGALA
jgi:hypothetical protein